MISYVLFLLVTCLLVHNLVSFSFPSILSFLTTQPKFLKIHIYTLYIYHLSVFLIFLFKAFPGVTNYTL